MKLPLYSSSVLSTLLASLLIALAFSGSAQLIPNGGLERWQMTPFQHPDSFYTSDAGTSTASVTRTTNAYSGQYAAKIETINTPWGIQRGGLWYGAYDEANTIFMGWPVSGKPTQLSFWYMYNRQGIDTAIAVLFLTQWKNGMRSNIGYGFLEISSNTPFYTQAIVPITGLSEQPDSITIGFISSNSIATVGSTLYIDEISLEFETGIQETFAAEILHPYPNPTTGMLSIDLPGQGLAIIAVTDIAGNTLYSREHSGQKLDIDCRNWPAGMYFVRVQNGDMVYRGKFVRQ